jgi:hypothetical protein
VTVTNTQQKTFAQALSNVCDIPTSQLPQPCLKGDRFAIAIPDEEYLAGLDERKYNLHGRIIWPKGSAPISVDNLRSKLLPLWKSIGKWGITSIGRGFYEFREKSGTKICLKTDLNSQGLICTFTQYSIIHK